MPKILIVDDEREIARIVQEFLSKQGYSVSAFNEGGKALGAISSGEKFDLMILDMKMPQVTGIDILKAMKTRNLSTPVIVLSGSIGGDDNVDALRELGYDEKEVLYKPIDLFDLLNKVQEKLR